MEKTISVNKERTTAMDCCETALLAVLIAVSGTFRIPGIVPGTEFQLSAPIAVAVCGVFGFKKYIIAGILASLMGLSLGTCNLLNVAIQMSFRLGKGLTLMLIAAAPGMAFTAATAWAFGKIFTRCRQAVRTSM